MKRQNLSPPGLPFMDCSNWDVLANFPCTRLSETEGEGLSTSPFSPGPQRKQSKSYALLQQSAKYFLRLMNCFECMLPCSPWQPNSNLLRFLYITVFGSIEGTPNILRLLQPFAPATTLVHCEVADFWKTDGLKSKMLCDRTQRHDIWQWTNSPRKLQSPNRSEVIIYANYIKIFWAPLSGTPLLFFVKIHIITKCWEAVCIILYPSMR